MEKHQHKEPHIKDVYLVLVDSFHKCNKVRTVSDLGWGCA